MNCKNARRLISAFVDGELRPGKEAGLKEHLASCQPCREEMAGLKVTMEAMAACTDIEPSFTLADIRERAARRGSRNPVIAWLWPVPRAATAAMVVAALAMGSVSGIYYGSRLGSGSQSPSVVSTQHVSDSLGLDVFDDGLAGAMYVADARTQPTAGVRQ